MDHQWVSKTHRGIKDLDSERKLFVVNFPRFSLQFCDCNLFGMVFLRDPFNGESPVLLLVGTHKAMRKNTSKVGNSFRSKESRKREAERT